MTTALQTKNIYSESLTRATEVYPVKDITNPILHSIAFSFFIKKFGRDHHQNMEFMSENRVSSSFNLVSVNTFPRPISWYEVNDFVIDDNKKELFLDPVISKIRIVPDKPSNFDSHNVYFKGPLSQGDLEIEYEFNPLLLYEWSIGVCSESDCRACNAVIRFIDIASSQN